jgi:hypothetical protein
LHPLGRYPINAPQVKHTRQGWLGNEGLPAPQAQDFRLVQLSSGDAQMIGDAWLWEAVQLAKGTPGLEALVRAEGKRAPAPMVVLGSQQFERPLVRGTSQGEPAVVEACLGPVDRSYPTGGLGARAPTSDPPPASEISAARWPSIRASGSPRRDTGQRLYLIATRQGYIGQLRSSGYPASPACWPGTSIASGRRERTRRCSRRRSRSRGCAPGSSTSPCARGCLIAGRTISSSKRGQKRVGLRSSESSM